MSLEEEYERNFISMQQAGRLAARRSYSCYNGWYVCRWQAFFGACFFYWVPAGSSLLVGLDLSDMEKFPTKEHSQGKAPDAVRFGFAVAYDFCRVVDGDSDFTGSLLVGSRRVYGPVRFINGQYHCICR